MNVSELQKNADKLKEIIFMLGNENITSEKRLKEIIGSLKGIYSQEGFRHKYSDFFSTVNLLMEDDLDNADVLSVNLESLSRHLDDKDLEDKERNGIFKFIDHISLEIARCTSSRSIDLKLKKSENDLNITQEELKKAQEELKIAKTDLDKANEKIEASKTELIAILSIFAAIVFAFSGSLSLLGGAFTSLAESELLKISLIVLVCGLVLFNTIFLMMYLISKIIKRSIFAKCESEQCDCEINGKPKCKGIKKIQRRLPYIFWSNLILIGLIVVNIVAIILDNSCQFMPY